MDSAALALNTLSTSVSTLVGIGVEITIVVVVSTVVKRHRPDAYGKLLAWAVASLASTLTFSIAYVVAPMMVISAMGSGSDSILTAYAILHLIHAAVAVVLVVLLVRGLVALAQPPRPVVVPNDAPYR